MLSDPLLWLKVAVPSVVTPSLNVTVPVAPLVTVAVSVTDWLWREGLLFDASDTVLVALLTVISFVPLLSL